MPHMKFMIFVNGAKIGALAGKLMGAGGGGFLFDYDPKNIHQIIKSNLR